MADRTRRGRRTTSRRLTMSEFVRLEMPHLRVVSMSQPEPEFASHNVLATTDDVAVARTAVRDLEQLESGHATLGLVVLSRGGEAELVGGGADPEHVTGMVASRVVVGAAIGAVLGALLAGGVTAFVASGSTALMAAITGALLGGVFGAISVVFAGMGGGDAYRQSFVAPELAEVCVVSLHTDDPEEARQGRDRLAGRAWTSIVDVDAGGTRMSA